MKKLLLLAIIPAIAFGCRNNRKVADNAYDDRWESTEEVADIWDDDRYDEREEEYLDDNHNAENSLDYAGTYQGVIPCADCEGIELTIDLTDGGGYTMTLRYLGKGDNTKFENKGTFSWDHDGRIITLQDMNASSPPMKFLVGEDRITQLDLNGNRIQGDHADMYILRKK